jgi:hypothetical protein
MLACEQCGTERYGYNSHLYGAKLNGNLYDQAENNPRREKISAYQAAREYVKDAF